MSGCLFGMVIWMDFLLLEYEFLGKMLGMDMVMELVVEVVLVEAVGVVRAGFFVFSRRVCLGDVMDVKVVIEFVVGVVVLVWWKWAVV